jgi:hypothetical protein
MNYLTKGRTSEALAGDFSYEKRLLDRWFADTFGASR